MYEFFYNKLKFTIDLDVYDSTLLESSCLQNSCKDIEVKSLLKPVGRVSQIGDSLLLMSGNTTYWFKSREQV